MCLPFGRSRNSSRGSWGCHGRAATGTSGETDPKSPGEQRGGEGQRGTSQLYPVFPPPRRFQAPQKRRCQGLWKHPLATSTYLAHAVPMTGILQAWRHVGSVWRAQDTEGAVLGVKPNKPNATDYQQPLTAQEAPGKPPTNTMGTRRDSHRKSLIQLLIWNYRYEVLP